MNKQLDFSMASAAIMAGTASVLYGKLRPERAGSASAKPCAREHSSTDACKVCRCAVTVCWRSPRSACTTPKLAPTGNQNCIPVQAWAAMSKRVCPSRHNSSKGTLRPALRTPRAGVRTATLRQQRVRRAVPVARLSWPVRTRLLRTWAEYAARQSTWCPQPAAWRPPSGPGPSPSASGSPPTRGGSPAPGPKPHRLGYNKQLRPVETHGSNPLRTSRASWPAPRPPLMRWACRRRQRTCSQLHTHPAQMAKHTSASSQATAHHCGYLQRSGSTPHRQGRTQWPPVSRSCAPACSAGRTASPRCARRSARAAQGQSCGSGRPAARARACYQPQPSAQVTGHQASLWQSCPVLEKLSRDAPCYNTCNVAGIVLSAHIT